MHVGTGPDQLDKAGDDSKAVYLHESVGREPASKRVLATLWPESRGIQPIEAVERTQPHYFSLFTLWMSASMTIAAFSTGSLGPLVYELSLEASFGVIVGVNLLSCSIPAFIGLMGPKTGMRQMTLARWACAWPPMCCRPDLRLSSRLLSGHRASPVQYRQHAGILLAQFHRCATPRLSDARLDLATVGAQALVAASRNQDLDIAVGIVIVAVAALFISLLGYRALHAFERWACACAIRH
jgi:hypothetical protein